MSPRGCRILPEPSFPSDTIAASSDTRPKAFSGAAPPIPRIGGGDALPASLRSGVVAIGNFDGVHLGHQAVLRAALQEASRRTKPALVLTFEPHPRELFSGEAVPRLSPAGEKAAILGLMGFDAVVEEPFTPELAGLDPDAFARNVLEKRLGAAHVVVGHDFRYGAKRAGDANTLHAHKGFGTSVVAAQGDRSGETVSSSRIREALSAGDMAKANALLGRRWRVRGEVRHGRKVGRTIGYPTANMVLDAPAMLAHGIYAVRLRRANGALHDGVASYGRRPTFDDGAPLLETFLFDFSDDLYGEAVHVSLFERLRGEEKFDTVEALIEQMDKDSERARELLREAEPLGDLDRLLNFEPAR